MTTEQQQGNSVGTMEVDLLLQGPQAVAFNKQWEGRGRKTKKP